jgi:quercetin dioxygenase-like cupin family protein
MTMNASLGSCENPSASGGRQPTGNGVEQAGSRVLRFQADYRWQGVPVTDYKAPGDHWCGILRTVLVGDSGEGTGFQVRYFEIAPGGFSSLERHAHEHAVVVLRGRGQVQLGDQVHELGFGDTVYVAPNDVHQFRNPSAAEPFGFLCVVDAQRDRPLLER